jgi:protein-S-isoprenylcysteine O-methyltransferase Ste14
MEFNSNKIIEKITAGILFLSLILGFAALGYPYALRSRGDMANRDVIVFVILFALMFVLAYLAKWQITDNDFYKSEKKDNQQKVSKGFWYKIKHNKNATANNLIGMAFHFFPLYFTLFLIKLDLFVGYKAGIFVFAIFSYLLVEIKYVFDRAIYFGKKIRDWNNTAFWIYFFLAPFLILFGIGWVAYNLILFYMHRFPVN